MRYPTLLTTLLGAALVVGAFQAQAQVVIISAKNPISKLTKEQVAQIFLGQTKTFHTGGMAMPLDLSEGSALRNDFYQKLTGKNAAQMKAHWSKLTFAGTAQPPKALDSDAEVVKMVGENPKYIGYVSSSAADGSVKVVFTP